MKQFKLNKSSIHLGDCLQLMQFIPDKSIDMILADLPYGTTACKWDTIICLSCLWKNYNRIIKDNGAIVLTASQPFTTTLIQSNIKYFKYSWIWRKETGTGFQVAKYRPMIEVEDIVVFCKKSSVYNPIMIPLDKPRVEKYASSKSGSSPLAYINKGERLVTHRYPKNVLEYKRDRPRIHETQKPVALFEYLIKTYTNKGEIVLDNTAGSFTTSIACINTGRKFICMEKEESYFYIGYDRIYNHIQDKKEEDKDFKLKYKIYQ